MITFHKKLFASPRMIEIERLKGEGYKHHEIAALLGIGKATVDMYSFKINLREKRLAQLKLMGIEI